MMELAGRKHVSAHLALCGLLLVIAMVASLGGADSAGPPTARMHLQHRLVLPSLENPRLAIAFRPSLPYIRALTHAPRVLEPELVSGKWLVLVCTVNSVPDTQCIGVALRAAQVRRGKLRLGVRPAVLFHEETARWFPKYAITHASPLWILFEDGKLIRWHVGPKTDAELADFLNGKTGWVP
ncbi:MAG: hypothetical protein ACRC33_11955 [Gemmataceae bacterium]